MTDLFNTVETQLQSLASPGIKPGLARLAKLLDVMGNPQRKFKAVHVVGTNGKGSTAASIENILRCSGYITALYTSPHLVSFGERLLINGTEADASCWLSSIKKIKQCIESDSFLSSNKPTYFELTTAAALDIIASSEIDIAVAEAGLGGRLDATNIMTGIILTVVTTMGIDHTDFLGNTLYEISNEKFAVMRKNVPCIFAGGDEESQRAFKENLKRSGAKGYLLDELCGRNLVSIDFDGTEFEFFDKQRNLALNMKSPLIGTHQVINCSQAMISALILKEKFEKITDASIKKGIETVKWQGRMEVVSREPVMMLDGAHNAHAMAQFVPTVKALSQNRKLRIVIAMMKDKDVSDVLALLKQLNALFYATCVPDMLPRSLTANEMAEKISGIPMQLAGTFENPVDALQKAVRDASPDDIIVCCGSLYLVGFLKRSCL